MKNISAFAELLYVVSNFEKGRIKSSGIWKRKYVKALKNSLEIMVLLTHLISTNKEISQDEIRFLQGFIHQNNGVIFSGEGNINALIDNKKEFGFSSHDFENVIKMMNDIILEIQNLLSTKTKKYKTKISYLLKAFHNLPRAFLDPNDATVFNLGFQPISPKDAIEYSCSYLLAMKKIS